MTPSTARTMAQYNRWMNERLYKLCATLTDEQRKRDLRGFFKSVHGTLNHLLLGDKIGLARLTGKTFAVSSLSQELHTDFGELGAERRAMDGARSRT